MLDTDQAGTHDLRPFCGCRVCVLRERVLLALMVRLLPQRADLLLGICKADARGFRFLGGRRVRVPRERALLALPGERGARY